MLQEIAKELDVDDDAELVRAIVDGCLNGELGDMHLHGNDFNKSGKPELLYAGRVSEGDLPQGMIIEGREALSRELQDMPRKIYKKCRSLMMGYDMGKEIPAMFVGADESILITKLSL